MSDPFNAVQSHGKRLVIAVIVIGFLVPVAVILLYVVTRGAAELPRQLSRLILTGLLAYFLYRGYSWARWVTGVLSAIGGVAFVVMAILVAMNKPEFAVLAFICGIAYLFSGWVVLASPSAKEFLLAQRAKRIEPTAKLSS